MGAMFSVSEIIQVAVDDERSGVAFYSALAEKTRPGRLKATFEELARQERYHQQRFEAMLASAGQVKSPDSYRDEYVAYLRALEGDRAFPDEQSARRQAADCPDAAAALALALRFERDTLVLMNEMKGLVRPGDGALVEELIREEQSHLVTLAAARSALGGQE